MPPIINKPRVKMADARAPSLGTLSHVTLVARSHTALDDCVSFYQALGFRVVQPSLDASLSLSPALDLLLLSS